MGIIFYVNGEKKFISSINNKQTDLIAECMIKTLKLNMDYKQFLYRYMDNLKILLAKDSVTIDNIEFKVEKVIINDHIIPYAKENTFKKLIIKTY